MHILSEVLDIKVGSSNEWRLCACNFVPCWMFIQQPSRSAILLPLSQQVIIQLNHHFLSATGSHLFVDTWLCTEFIRLLKFGLWSTHWEKRLWDEGLDIQILHLIDWVTHGPSLPGLYNSMIHFSFWFLRFFLPLKFSESISVLVILCFVPMENNLVFMKSHWTEKGASFSSLSILLFKK